MSCECKRKRREQEKKMKKTIYPGKECRMDCSSDFVVLGLQQPRRRIGRGAVKNTRCHSTDVPASEDLRCCACR